MGMMKLKKKKDAQSRNPKQINVECYTTHINLHYLLAEPCATQYSITYI